MSAALLSPEAFALYASVASFAAGHLNARFQVLSGVFGFLANALAQPQPKKPDA